MKTRVKNHLRIILIFALCFTVIFFVYNSWTEKAQKDVYKKAEEAFMRKDYEVARDNYNYLGEYKDSKEKMQIAENYLKYNNACVLYDAGKLEEAKQLFEELGDFEDSKDYVLLCSIDDYNKLQDEIIENAKQLMDAGYFFSAVDQLSLVENYKDAKELLNECSMSIWRRCLSTTVSAGPLTSMGITEEGLKTAGKFDYGQDKLDSEGLISISDGGYFTVGVYKDGTAKVAGKIDWANDLKSRSVSNVIEGVAGFDYVAFLYEDGHVEGDGYNGKEGDEDRISFKGWTDIVDIDAGHHLIAGVNKNGKVYVTGRNATTISTEIANNSDKWKDVYKVAVGGGEGKEDGFVVGLKKDHTVIVAGKCQNGVNLVENWSNISDISAGDYHVVGLTSEGQVVASYNKNKEDASTACNFDKWKDIRFTEIEAGNCTTLLVDENGTVYSCGYDHQSQIPKSETWTGILDFKEYSLYDYLFENEN